MCTGIIIATASCLIGVFLGSEPYDYQLLFNGQSTQAHFDKALEHYRTLHETPLPVLYILAAVALLGISANIVRIYKPNPELSMFEYCSLGLYVIAVSLFITNIKTGVECAVTGHWGDVTQNEGLAVLASSHVILILVLLGVILLQAGLWYSNMDYQKRLAQFYAEEAAEKASGSKKRN